MEKQEHKSNSDSKSYVLKLTEISILLNSYDDIFSDFDPSVYSERIISDDFLLQVIKFSKNKEGNKMSLNLLLPAKVRDEHYEKVITKRLHTCFRDMYNQLSKNKRISNRKGFILAFSGFLLVIIASYLSFIKDQKYSIHLLLVLFEPAGWFLLWAGLDHLVYQSKSVRNELQFYSKMIKCEIRFLTY